MTTYHLGMMLVAQLLVCHAAEATSQKVYRCGPDGRVYSQMPCKDGYEAKPEDKRTPEQRKAAEDSVKREEKQSKEAAAAQGAAPIANPATAKPAASGASASASNRKPEPKKAQSAQP